jgi:hypothetical protein
MTDWKPPTLALRTTPGVDHIVSNYLDNQRIDVERFNKRLDELAEKLGETALVIRHSYDGLWVNGFQHNGTSDYTPPAGWRLERSSDTYVPAVRSKLGKEHAALLASYSYRYKDLPGLPRIIWGEGHMGTWTLEHLGGHGFATITVPLGERSENQTRMCDVDTNLWERVPLSTYHLAKEAHHDRDAD